MGRTKKNLDIFIKNRFLQYFKDASLFKKITKVYHGSSFVDECKNLEFALSDIINTSIQESNLPPEFLFNDNTKLNYKFNNKDSKNKGFYILDFEFIKNHPFQSYANKVKK